MGEKYYPDLLYFRLADNSVKVRTHDGRIRDATDDEIRAFKNKVSIKKRKDDLKYPLTGGGSNAALAKGRARSRLEQNSREAIAFNSKSNGKRNLFLSVENFVKTLPDVDKIETERKTYAIPSSSEVAFNYSLEEMGEDGSARLEGTTWDEEEIPKITKPLIMFLLDVSGSFTGPGHQWKSRFARSFLEQLAEENAGKFRYIEVAYGRGWGTNNSERSSYEGHDINEDCRDSGNDNYLHAIALLNYYKPDNVVIITDSDDAVSMMEATTYYAPGKVWFVFVQFQNKQAIEGPYNHRGAVGGKGTEYFYIPDKNEAEGVD